MQNMRAFKTVCPLRNELHLDITTAVKVTANPLVMLNVFDLHINVHTRTYICIMVHRLQNVVMLELLVMELEKRKRSPDNILCTCECKLADSYISKYS